MIASTGLLSYYFSGSHTFLDISLLLCCAKSIDFDKFCKKAFVAQLVSVMLIVLLCSVGLISDSTRYHSANGVTGSSMGFNHPNTLALLVFQLIAFILIRKKDGRGIVKYLVCIGAGLICYSVTDSNTGIIVSAILMIACMIYDFLNRGILTEKQIKRLVTFVTLIVVAVGIYIVVYYWRNPYQLQGLARTMRSRILMAQGFIDSYGIHLFGNMIAIEEGAWLDNAQVRLLVQYGIIPFFIYYYVMVKMIVGLLHDGDIVMFIVAIAYIVYSLSEFKSIRPEYDFMWIFAGMKLFEQHKSASFAVGLSKKHMYEYEGR
ncbi:MAG: hypothetical protein LUJ25_08275 [Firmicutes bacterium]|nr:hypothetical protein [Bacillota bacterium]